jgi:hypothetical protein
MPGFLMLGRGAHAVPLVCVNGAEEVALARQLGGHPALEAAKSAISRHEQQVRKIFYQHRPKMRAAEFVSGDALRAVVKSLVKYADAGRDNATEEESQFLDASNVLVQKERWLGVPEAQALFIRAILTAKARILFVMPPASAFVFQLSDLEALKDVCSRGVIVEIYAGMHDTRFFGERSVFGKGIVGLSVSPMSADRTWCGFSCDDNFCVIGGVKTVHISMGRLDVFFGGVILSDVNATSLLLNLGSPTAVQVSVKTKRKVLPLP